MATSSAIAPLSDTTHLFATGYEGDAPPKSRCPTSKKVKAVALEALYAGLIGAAFGSGFSLPANLSISVCTIGMGALEGLAVGIIAGAARKIIAYKTPHGYDPTCRSGVIAAGLGLAAGLAIGAGIGAATASMGCWVGPMGGIASGMMIGAISGIFAPSLRVCCVNPDTIDNDITFEPTPTPTPLEDPIASNL